MDTNKYSVLVVDDDFATIMALTEILKWDFKIFIEKDGYEAIDTAEGLLPDIIMLDILMPKLDGFKTLERLKRSEKTKNIPIIIVTSLDKEEDMLKGYDLGAADYIVKPVSAASIKYSVRNQVEKIQKRSERE